METIKLSEQDIVNAICLHTADKKQVEPQEVEVELLWDEQYGFSSEIYTHGRKQVLIEANMLEAIRFWIDRELQRDPFSAGIQLQLEDEEGIVAYLRY
ncbi:hypothetical protein BEP19_01225 [Ammoniphilus oxalaticus]|uniref:DUF2653 domain-containing protein n=1 Tax=Ammoniphilus oxalaticus TaxID=66863 RepID=A0A419SMU4_9BACL|nr:YxcD family protein [Ammoniphilus oxalaticus]RKD25595.1 hypothetical protein BEP19_01225 [Ammoniphilus oxalaticus]